MGDNGPRLCVLSVHAHPDDEASKGASTMARYAAEGVRTVLVTCTGGEAGDILNEEADSPAGAGRHRRGADARARRKRPDHRVPPALSARLPRLRDARHRPQRAPRQLRQRRPRRSRGRLAHVIRAEQAQVIISYPDSRGGGYAHPDHIRVHDISVLAFDRAGDPDWYPDAVHRSSPSSSTSPAASRVRAHHQDARVLHVTW